MSLEDEGIDISGIPKNELHDGVACAYNYAAMVVLDKERAKKLYKVIQDKYSWVMPIAMKWSSNRIPPNFERTKQ